MLTRPQVILTIAAIVAVAGHNTYVEYMGNNKHPSLPNYCYYSEINLTIGVNETVNPQNIDKTCIQVFCSLDHVLEIRHCEIPPSDQCQLSEYDYRKPYPKCCPLITCPNQVYRQQT